MTVLWPIGRSGFGTMFVSGCSLVPRPPARITAVFNEASLKRNTVTPDEQLVSTVIGRSTSLFDADLREHGEEVKRRFSGARVLVIGAAGSIGAAVVRQLIAYGPSMLSLVDPNENGLVELVREARSGRLALPPDFETHAVALGSVEFAHLLRATGAVDFVLNLAALKHVRSERDPFTLMRMLETNVLALDTALDLLAAALGATNEIYVPQLSEALDAVTLESIARRVLHHAGFEAVECSSEEEARYSPLLTEAAPTRWPCYFGESDTSGEKEVEELVGSHEAVDRTRHRTIAVVRQSATDNQAGLREARLELERIRGKETWDKSAIVAAVQKAVPEFRHLERGKSLDRKM